MYENEPRGIFFMVDNKSFYASVEAVARGYDPLKAVLVVMSEQANTNGGLILATSPMAKKLYGLKANVSRQRDLPDEAHLIVVPPRMNLYIKRNLEINALFTHYAPEEDIWPYSIDESLIDLTHSWRLFGKSPIEVAKRLQEEVRQTLGLRVTVGIGENPLQAKLALDLFAKRAPSLIGTLAYQTIATKLWPITELTDVWSIGHRMAARLNRLNIHTVDELAHADPYQLKATLGLMGEQLFALSWGIDRAQLHEAEPAKAPSLNNSQVLPRDYAIQEEIELVIKEIGEQVAARLRHHHQQAGTVRLDIGFSYAASQEDGRGGFNASQRIPPTNQDRPITMALVRLFRQQWQGQVVRHVGVSAGHLVHDAGMQLNLFEPVTPQLRRQDLTNTLDAIRARFGFTSLVYAESLLRGGTAIQRANLVGGHNGGNSYE